MHFRTLNRVIYRVVRSILHKEHIYLNVKINAYAFFAGAITCLKGLRFETHSIFALYVRIYRFFDRVESSPHPGFHRTVISGFTA